MTPWQAALFVAGVAFFAPAFFILVEKAHDFWRRVFSLISRRLRR